EESCDRRKEEEEKAIDGGEEDRKKRSLMESGTKLRPGYMVINNGMIHYQSKSLKLTRKTPTASTYKSVIICATSTMFKCIGLPKPNLNSEYSQRLSTLLCRNCRYTTVKNSEFVSCSDETEEKMRALMKKFGLSRSKSLREKLTSLCSENITEVAREGGSDEVELNWDGYEKANREISYDKLKLAEEKAIRKEQDKMRAEEAAHAKTEKMRRVIHKKKTSLGIIPIGKYMVLSYSQAGETGLGTDKEREEKEEKEDIFHYLIISKLARTNGKMVFHQNLFFFYSGITGS
ncbi:LOW QUALITY PROTEIN: hypothetical protein HID58_066148, partial [Brassica napus]